MTNLYLATFNESFGCSVTSKRVLGIFSNETDAMAHCAFVSGRDEEEMWKWETMRDGSYVFRIDTGTYYLVRPIEWSEAES